ncbi:phosphoglucosamine mutase [Candidatus Woesearchaeota archaeon]|nr:phosphoglucosamine mutase [Candidatus Woesearchaeota archaeon]
MRKLFGTDGVRGCANKYPITAEMALKIGKAAAVVLKKSAKNPKFIIGKDTRLSGYMLEYALTSGITSIGADVLLVGPLPTPAVAHLTRSFAADAGIMISASHNPAEDNGIKLFDKNGFKLPDEVEEKIEKMIFIKNLSEHNVSSLKIGRAYRIDDAQGRYIEYAKASVNNISLKGLKVVVDCANGAGYKVSPTIFRELGADVVVINNSPDGLNINKDSGALHPEILKAAVLGHQADIGISLDGDADRIISVDEKGNILDGDILMAVSALHMKNKGKLKNNTVVVTKYTNLGFDDLMKKNSIKVVRVKNGDRYVIEEMRKNNFNLGGEQSGHIIFSDYNSTGDGTISGLQILRIMKLTGKKLSELSSEFERYPQVLLNVDISEKKTFKKIPGFSKKLKQAEKQLKENGRVFVRYSGTQDVCRIMVEGKDKDQINGLANQLKKIIKKEIGK